MLVETLSGNFLMPLIDLIKLVQSVDIFLLKKKKNNSEKSPPMLDKHTVHSYLVGTIGNGTGKFFR